MLLLSVIFCVTLAENWCLVFVAASMGFRTLRRRWAMASRHDSVPLPASPKR